MEEQKTLTSEFKYMEVGEQKKFPAAKSMSIRSLVSALGFRWNRRYSAKIT